MTAAAVQPGPWRRRLRRTAAALGVIVALGLGFMIVDGWRAFGHRATGARRARMERSPQWQQGRPLREPAAAVERRLGRDDGDVPRQPVRQPDGAVPTAPVDPARFATPPATGLRVTWLGHATMLIEIDGHRVLTDPVWSERASPLDWIGPQRWYTPRIALAALPPIDAVVISHDHYDHLDHRTIVAMQGLATTTFVVPLGIGAHLAYWGVPESRIVELDWWERTRVGDAGDRLHARAPRRRGARCCSIATRTLWAGYALVGPRHRAYFSGDTGLFPAMRDIGARLGPFDVTMIEVGQYHRAWPDWHIGPEQAVLAHGMVRGRVMLPMHWGLFSSRRTAGPSRSSARSRRAPPPVR